MHVDEVVSDEGISGGVSFKDRKLGRTLLPKMKAGDMLIVSEVSRLGRSMFDLSNLIHTELKPRKIRLVCVSMGIDLRCDKMTAIDELILNNFSFAAQLEKQLISERTLSALQVKRQQGVKLGGAAIKWRESYKNKSKEQKEKEQMRKGETKRQRYHDNIDTKTFLRVLKMVQPEHCAPDDPKDWEWVGIDTKCGRREQMLTLMKNFQENDEEGRIFRKWDFTDISSKKNKDGLCAYIQRVRISFTTNV
jgi:DNA invertase Pin-like site-specific DNA recombinase